MSCETRLTFLGATCSFLSLAMASMGVFYFFFLLVCPLKFRVGENSPSLCPTVSSVAKKGMNFFPLCISNFIPTKLGVMVADRAYVLMGRLSFSLVTMIV